MAGELFKITGTESTGSNTWQKLWAWITSLPEANLPTLVVGILALALVFGIKLLCTQDPRCAGCGCAGHCGDHPLQSGQSGVSVIGDVPRGLPSLTLPDLGLILDNFALILGRAVGSLLIGFSVTTAAVRDYANKHNYRVDINQELLAQGVSNVSASLFQGIFDNGSLSKSPVNDESGARSQISNLVQAGLHIPHPNLPGAAFFGLARGGAWRSDHRGGRHGHDGCR